MDDPHALNSGGVTRDKMREYLSQLWLVAGDELETTLHVLYEYERMAEHLGFSQVILILDFAERVPLPRAGGADFSDAQLIDLVMRGLKASP